MKKILVIDDDIIARTTIALILVGAGFQVVTAEDGNKGLVCMHNEQPDVVITDLIMPGKEGIETIRDILAEQSKAKIIAISGGGRACNLEYLHLAKALGAIETLAKPFEPEDLLSCVDRCLNAAKANRYLA